MVSKRLLSLDVMRGLTIALMILVNTPGSWEYVYAPLLHSKWHGCTPTDLVFPFFLFIVGVSLWYSSKKFNNKIDQKSFLRILKRSSILFGLGVFLNAYPHFDFENLRIFGVLQRIGLAYFVGGLICIPFKSKQLLYIFFSIIISYWLLLTFGATDFPFGLENNLVRKIDVLLFGEQHLYQGFGIPFDPEGLLGTLPAIATLLIGYFAGQLIEYSANTKKAVLVLLICGITLTALGRLWHIAFPINKALWTSSYVLFSGGLALVFLSLLLWLVDVSKVTFWTKPFIHFGTNPLFIYLFSGVYVNSIIYLVKIKTKENKLISGYEYLYTEIFAPLVGNLNGSLLFGLVHIIFFWSVVYFLYKKRIFIKI
ncbi:acyltransferase family protein [Bacteroidota bacterium]